MERLRSKIASSFALVLLFSFMASVTVSAAQANKASAALSEIRQQTNATVYLTSDITGEVMEVAIDEVELLTTPQAVVFGTNGEVSGHVAVSATGYVYTDEMGMLRASGSRNKNENDNSDSANINLTIYYSYYTQNTRLYVRLDSVNCSFRLLDSSVTQSGRYCKYGQMGRDPNGTMRSTGEHGGAVSGTSYVRDTGFDFYVFGGSDETSSCNSYAGQNLKRGTYTWSMEVMVSAI